MDWIRTLLVEMKLVTEDDISRYEMTEHKVIGLLEPEDAVILKLPDNQILHYNGSWEDQEGTMSKDLFCDDQETIVYVRLHDVPGGEEITIRCGFNEGQLEQLAQIALRAAIDGKLTDRMKSELYDLHLCTMLDLDLETISILRSQVGAMLENYIGASVRLESDPEYYKKYKEEYIFRQNYCDLQAVYFMLEQAQKQLHEIIKETIEDEQDERYTRKHRAVDGLARKAAEIDEVPYEECYECYAKAWDEAEESYKKNDIEKRYCTKCGMLLHAGSMAYVEGWHFDTCL